MFKLMTDTSANLEPNVISAYDIGVIPFNYYLNGDERTCMDIAAFDGKAYYDAIRSGAKASTSQVPPQRYIEYMEPVLKQGLDILFIGMSSGISGSYSSAETAASELREQYPERKIITVDTLSASLGEGLFVIRAGEMMREGADMEEIAREIINMRHKMCQVFTVDDYASAPHGQAIQHSRHDRQRAEHKAPFEGRRRRQNSLFSKSARQKERTQGHCRKV